MTPPALNRFTAVSILTVETMGRQEVELAGVFAPHKDT